MPYNAFLEENNLWNKGYWQGSYLFQGVKYHTLVTIWALWVFHERVNAHMSRNVRKRTFCHVRQNEHSIQPAHSRCLIRAFDVDMKKLHPSLSALRPGKILIRLCDCESERSESSLGARAQRYVFCHCGPYLSVVKHGRIMSDVMSVIWRTP